MKQKFYVLIKDDVSENFNDLKVFLFESKEKAQQAMNDLVDETFGKDCDKELEINGHIVERSEDCISIYMEGYYMTTHFDVSIQEVELQ